MAKNIQFKIRISDTYTIKWSIVDSNKKETPIQLHNKTQEEYPLSSSLIDEKSSIEFAGEATLCKITYNPSNII